MQLSYGGTYQTPVDYNAAIANATVLNDIIGNVIETEDGEKVLTTRDLLDMIKVEYDGDHISTIPRCSCGHFNRPDKRYKTCPRCNTQCVTITNHAIEADMFIRPPKGVHKLMRPASFTMLSNFFTHSKLNVIAFLINRNEKVPPRLANLQTLLESHGIKRGLNFFIENFDRVVEVLIGLKLHRSVNKAEKAEFLQWIKQYQSSFFVDYLPIPSKITFVTEVTPLGKYVDGTITDALDSICSILNIDENSEHTSSFVKENRSAKAIMQLADFYYTYIKTHINPKEGWSRQHMYGTMTDFTGYCVISSTTRNVDVEAVKTPWSYSVGLLKMHISSWIINNNPGMNARKIEERIIQAVSKYDPHKGLPCLILRNPSLDKLSIQCMYITEIKTDLSDRTLSIPILNTKGSNADFDGDHMALRLINDMNEYEYLKALLPGNSFWDLQRLRSIRRVNDFHSPFYSNISNFLYGSRRRKTKKF
jgi:hypothetical protein